MFKFLLIFVFFLSVKSEDPESRIVGGTTAVLNQTNHQVSFRVKSYEVQSLGSGHFCGGSVISSRTILTAAHCFYTTYDRPDLFAVVVGSLRLSGYDADRTEICLVEEIVIHSGFDPSSFVNDIAVVYTTKTISSEFIIEIASNYTSVGALCQVTGWGTTQYGGYSSNQLLTANIVIQEMDICNSTDSYNGSLLTGMICAGIWEGGVDACQGDSGGPVVYNNTLIGVTSWGNQCALPQFPGIYTNVSYYSDWIKNNSLGSRASHLSSAGIFNISLLFLKKIISLFY